MQFADVVVGVAVAPGNARTPRPETATEIKTRLVKLELVRGGRHEAMKSEAMSLHSDACMRARTAHSSHMRKCHCAGAEG
jgi:hypothetical protein